MLSDLATAGWALLIGVTALVGTILAATWRGAKKERDRREAQDARDYRRERREIDNADLGHGATDQQRIDRLREIAERRGSAGPH